jgi:hypothetical protein
MQGETVTADPFVSHAQSMHPHPPITNFTNLFIPTRQFTRSQGGGQQAIGNRNSQQREADAEEGGTEV